MILSLQLTQIHPVYLAMNKSRKQREKFQPKKGKQVHPTPSHTENSNFSLLYYRQREITCLRTSAEERSRHVALRAICSDYWLWMNYHT